MTGPFTGGRKPQSPLPDNTLETGGWAVLENLFKPAIVADHFRPDDELLIEVYKFSITTEGRRIFDWLHSLTDCAPYPMGTKSIEETAIAGARHQGRAGVGHVLVHAVDEGEKLFNAKRSST